VRKIKKYLLGFLWVFILFILYKNGLLTFEVEKFQELLEENKESAMLLFLLLFSIRVFLFLPGLPFMVMGGVMFGGVRGFILSMIGISVSLSFVYIISTIFSESAYVKKIKKKHKKLLPMVERYNHKFLAVGILAPIANTDIVCLLSTFTGITYKRYILTATLVNIPTVLLYSLLGNTYNTSLTGMIMIGLFSILNFSVGFYILWKIKTDMKNHHVEH
jgi:uncharacterized membrane protein YdjX (TVP38/TMEM64 family)